MHDENDPTRDALTASAEATLDTVADLVRGRPLAVLTGAGVSTDSGIPDYRSPGAPVRTPMTFDRFLESEDHRRRYWAGSHLGWRRFRSTRPNGGHVALARLEQHGHTNGVVTQNVDGLHTRAGSRNVIDLHGSMDRVICLDCGATYARETFAEALTRENPWIATAAPGDLGPDGDVIPERLDGFVVPRCAACGGTLKPDVVFFGEFVPAARFAEARSLIDSADALLIAGSSLTVNSGIRLLDAAVRRSIPVIIINRGATKGDNRATLRLDAGTTPALEGLVERLT